MISAKYYLNQFSFHIVIMKVTGVNFFSKHSAYWYSSKQYFRTIFWKISSWYFRTICHPLLPEIDDISRRLGAASVAIRSAQMMRRLLAAKSVYTCRCWLRRNRLIFIRYLCANVYPRLPTAAMRRRTENSTYRHLGRPLLEQRISRTSRVDDIIHAFCIMSPLWRHTVAWRHRSRDHSTQHRRFPIAYGLNRNQTRMSLSLHDVITDVIAPGSAIRLDPINKQHRRPFS